MPGKESEIKTFYVGTTYPISRLHYRMLFQRLLITIRKEKLLGQSPLPSLQQHRIAFGNETMSRKMLQGKAATQNSWYDATATTIPSS